MSKTALAGRLDETGLVRRRQSAPNQPLRTHPSSLVAGLVRILIVAGLVRILIVAGIIAVLLPQEPGTRAVSPRYGSDGDAQEGVEPDKSLGGSRANRLAA